MVCGNCGSENHRKNSTNCPKRDLYLAELAERQKLLGGGQSSSSSSSSNRMEVDSSQRSQRKRVGENGDGGATGEKIVRYVENDDKDESLEETQDGDQETKGQGGICRSTPVDGHWKYFNPGPCDPELNTAT